VVYPRWSFSYPSANFTGAAVSMTHNGAGVPLVPETVADGYGENTLVWRLNDMDSWASWPQPAADRSYRVTVSNVIISGTPRSFTYEVTVFDPATGRALPFLPLLLD
jgi:hypothetical protein